jgi:hypothetical protein
VAGDLRTTRNELIETFAAAWKGAALAFPYFKPGVWPYVLTMTDADTVPENPNALPWARLTIQHSDSKSRGISKRRVVHKGILTVQVFVPRTRTTADNQAQQIADYLVKAFVQHRGNVELYDVGPEEGLIDNGFARCACVALFTWDQFIARPGA